MELKNILNFCFKLHVRSVSASFEDLEFQRGKNAGIDQNWDEIDQNSEIQYFVLLYSVYYSNIVFYSFIIVSYRIHIIIMINH